MNGSVGFVIVLLCSFTLATSKNSQSLCLHWLVTNQFGSSLRNICLGGNSAIVLNGVWMTYTAYYAGTERTVSERRWIEYNTQPPDVLHQEDNCQLMVSKVEYNFIQPEHGGGNCQCINISFSEDCQDSSAAEAR